MTFIMQMDAPPIKEDANGALRVGETRVLLELVIRAFEEGALPETIVDQYPALTLADVYAVITYYLRHPEQIDAYLSAQEKVEAAVRVKIEARQGDLRAVRERLLSRRRA